MTAPAQDLDGTVDDHRFVERQAQPVADAMGGRRVERARAERIEQAPQRLRLGVEPQPAIDHPLGDLVGAEAVRILGCRP